jgi:hypothetical protein
VRVAGVFREGDEAGGGGGGSDVQPVLLFERDRAAGLGAAFGRNLHDVHGHCQEALLPGMELSKWQ